jgi:hypothetical protein
MFQNKSLFEIQKAEAEAIKLHYCGQECNASLVAVEVLFVTIQLENIRSSNEQGCDKAVQNPKGLMFALRL